MRGCIAVAAYFGTLLLLDAVAQQPPQYKDVIYATVDGKELGLDISLLSGETLTA